MILVVDPHSGIPVYRQLVEQIRFHVASGLLQPGDEIPSTRALSTKLGINPMTISKAFVRLEEDGVLERRPGRPHVVREPQGGTVRASKLEQLEQALRPVATKARQLDLEPDAAVQVFRRLLEDDKR
jgi:GntR family transcriptional regulator